MNRKTLTRLLVLIPVFFAILGTLPARSAPQDLLYQDDFEDGDHTIADGANGLAWQVIYGGASVVQVDGSQQLGLQRGLSLAVTNQRFGDEYTVRLDGRITWSEHGRIVVLYQDANNYYSVGIGGEPGIFRMLGGVETQLHADPDGLLRLPHGSGEVGTFKVYAHNTGASIVIRADKAGDGIDYDIGITDTDPTAVATFTNAAVGLISVDEPSPYQPWIYFDNVEVHSGLLEDPYPGTTYYVDGSHPQASNANPGTESQPWLTIQHAADVVWAGDTVVVKSGTYYERIRFSSGTRGAPGQMITFRAEPRRTVAMWGFYTRYADYLRVEGFNISGDASLTDWTDRNGVYIASDHVEVVDNYIHHLGSTGIGGSSVGAYVVGNKIYQVQMGITVGGSGWLVEDNEVERLYDYGGGDCDYSRFFGDDHVIRSNFFHGTDFGEIGAAHVDCFQTFDNNGESAHNVTFDGNVCYDFHQGFMGEAAYYGDISDLTFSNNIFAHGGAWGLCVHQIKDVTAVNNIFADIRYHGIGFRDGATGQVYNNIFYNAGSNYWASDGGSVTGSHNIIYETDDTTDPASYPDDLVNIDPLLIDPANDDYHIPWNSPAVDAAINRDVTTDLEGATRPQGEGYDIGPYEFTPALTLWGRPDDQAAHLYWQVNITLPVSATWQIGYDGPAGDSPSPVTEIPEPTRAYTLTGLTNYTPYEFTLHAIVDGSAVLTDTVTIMPTDILIYFPVVTKNGE